ncbi:hypothetical protein NM688_g1055 [Phlebia brevispora]|uniref:Uncharacterized protein n=1 Tax=Phlebia brevispora TaxID=194682 RepID=A0ACC1TCT6_9APHY|nr:hypothetical protein NM688_g1055 [Phlebia brevispora]
MAGRTSRKYTFTTMGNSDDLGHPPPVSILPRFFTTALPSGEITDLDPTSQPPVDTEVEDPDIVDAVPGTVLKVKHLDEVLDPLTGQWNLKPTPPSETNSTRKNGKYDAYAFTIIRKFTPVPSNQHAAAPVFGKQAHPRDGGSYTMTKLLEIHSSGLKEVGTKVIGQIQGVSWTAKPLRVNPQVLLSWLPELEAHLAQLSEELEGSEDDSPVRVKHAHLTHLLSYLTTEYASALETLASLLEGAEITFDLLWALYVPRKTIIHIICPTTSEPRLCRLVTADKCQKADMMANTAAVAMDLSGLTLGFDLTGGGQSSVDTSKVLWRLTLEYLETDISAQGVQFGYAPLTHVVEIPGFSGTRKINDLGIYPVQYYAGPGGPAGLKERLTERGKRWVSLAGGVHHLAYKGIAYQWKKSSGGAWLDKYNVDSRIMIDRKTFTESMPTYDRISYVSKTFSGVNIDRHAIRTSITTSAGIPETEKLAKLEELTDDILMLAPASLFGFSLSDKLWCKLSYHLACSLLGIQLMSSVLLHQVEFTLDFIEPFTWNIEAYENLVIPTEQKNVLTTLVEAHSSVASQKIDDFISGKGQGLVINLYGNPGTGKSLTAEAMSEHLHKPLYVVGAGDLGTNATKVDGSLASILKISASWGAVVLIDEADVFLEERALHHIERNAMVAVFLRHLEYFRGILFLTTNRVRVFDEAFQSRIHVSLRYYDLNSDARRKIWVAFLRKVHGDTPDGGLSKEELRQLGEKKINGRQIKNVVKTASALATGRQETLSFKHLSQVLDMMDQFDAR